MTLDILLLWLVIWVVLLLMSTIEHRGPVFGVLAGIWIIYIGLYLYLDGLQTQTGMNILTTGSWQNVTNVYSDVTMPFSNYRLIWCIPFIALGIYIAFMSVTKKKTP